MRFLVWWSCDSKGQRRIKEDLCLWKAYAKFRLYWDRKIIRRRYNSEKLIKITWVTLRNTTWIQYFSTTNHVRYLWFWKWSDLGKSVERLLFWSVKTLGAFLLRGYTWIRLHAHNIETVISNLCDCVRGYHMLDYQLVEIYWLVLLFTCLLREILSIATLLLP